MLREGFDQPSHLRSYGLARGLSLTPQQDVVCLFAWNQRCVIAELEEPGPENDSVLNTILRIVLKEVVR